MTTLAAQPSTAFVDRLIDRGLLPDFVLRAGIRSLLKKRLAAIGADDPARSQAALMAHVAACSQGPIALAVDAANAQHYEVPAAFYEHVLGAHRKYSCGLFESGAATLDEAEAAMLRTTCERGELQDGMRVLDLGCGWGALSLWIAEHYPRCQVVGVSNSASQRADILARARARGLHNVEIVTANIESFAPAGTFDRVFSVEMFEHARNWRDLLRRVATWLVRDGRLFVHVFTHARSGYTFEPDGDGDWMARQFFTGGQMPADAQMLYFQDHLEVTGHWRVLGDHYRRTAECWLANMDAHRARLLPILRATHGDDASVQWHRWRVFFLACAELWGYRGGREWFVSHYVLRPRAATSAR